LRSSSDDVRTYTRQANSYLLTVCMCCTLLAQQRPRLGTEFDLYTVMTKLNFPYEALYHSSCA
jgi:hypothetical protein